MSVTVTTTEIAVTATESTVTVAPTAASVTVSVADSATSFLGLSDTPDAYTGQAGKIVKVNSGATGLEFGTGGGGGGSGDAVLADNNTFTGHNAFGADAAPDDGSLLYPGDTFNSTVVIAERLTDLSTTYVEGATIYTQLDPASAPSASAYGADIEVFTKASNAADYPYIAGVFGSAAHYGAGIVNILRGLFYFVSNSGAGDVADLAALELGIDNSGGGTVTAGKSIVIAAPAGSFGSSTGIDISGHDLAIRADAGATFGGDVTAPNLVTAETAAVYAIIFG